MRKISGAVAALGMALVDGQVVGDLRRSVTEREVRFDLTAWRDWAPDELAAGLQQVEARLPRPRLGRFRPS